MMRAIRIAQACIAMLYCMPAFAQNPLDAPLPTSAPTIGSEIKRGADAGNRCADLFTMPTRADGFMNCIDARQSANRQAMGTGYEAYDVGIYFVAKMNLNVSIEVLDGNRPEIRVIQAKKNLYDVYYRQARDMLHLTDAEAERGSFIGS